MYYVIYNGVGSGFITACGFCRGDCALVPVCPRQAIVFETMDWGEKIPYIDQEKCDQCGKCMGVCTKDTVNKVGVREEDCDNCKSIGECGLGQSILNIQSRRKLENMKS